jgi:hypothetical protein
VVFAGLRRHAALLLLIGFTLGGCASGRGAESAALLPSTPAVSSGPVRYMQSDGPLSAGGAVSQGAAHVLVAVISAVASPPAQFDADSLVVTAPGAAASAVRTHAARSARLLRPPPVEAFPASGSGVSQRLRSFAVAGAARRAVQTRSRILPAQAAVGAHAAIWVLQSGSGGGRANVAVPATLAVQTAHGNIWIDDSIAGLTSSGIAQIGADFENAYASDTLHFASPDYPASAPALQPQYRTCSSSGAVEGAAPAYVAEPADRRIDVMVVNGSALGGLGGYFSSANFMTQAALNCLGGGYESNEAPFIFVGWFGSFGTRYALGEDLVRSTAHELQHLINFVNHSILAPGASSSSFDGYEVQYVNEGLSMLAQDLAVARMYGTQGVSHDVDDAMARAAAYLDAPSNFSLSGFTGIDSPAWGGNGSPQYNCGGGCYGAVYLFQRYLYDRFGGDAYTHAMEGSGVTGPANLQQATGENPNDLFGDFALAMTAGTLGVTAADPRFDFGTLDLTGSYADQFGGTATLQGITAVPASGGSTAVTAPLGGFSFVSLSGIPAAGTSVQVTDRASVGGFSLLGGLAQH